MLDVAIYISLVIIVYTTIKIWFKLDEIQKELSRKK